MPASTAPPDGALELSVVIPCLNEAQTIEVCIRRALDAMAAHGIRGEVVVSDNGSTDGSIEISTKAGARVVSCPTRGYGAALQWGFRHAHGRYVLMGDADDTYDFTQIGAFLEPLGTGRTGCPT